jgi:glucosamine--fructose-6-phosphate aminotransferase (isomerizing)
MPRDHDMNGHHMIREIHEQPQAFDDIVNKTRARIKWIAREAWKRTHPGSYYVVGCGSSYYAAMLAAFYHEHKFGLDSRACPSSEFVWFGPRLSMRSPILMALSRSGRTSESVEASRKAKKIKIPTIAVVSDSQSTMGKECDYCLDTGVPNEESTIMTKTFTGGALATIIAGLEFARLTESSIPEDFEAQLSRLSKDAEAVIRTTEDQARRIAEKSQDIARFIYLGSGANYAACLEGALKLRETSYSASEAYHAMEFRHGPFAELEKGIQVLALVPEGKTVRQEATLLKEVASTGGSVVPISNVPEIINSHSDTIRMPSSISPEFAPLLFMIPMQFFAYYYTIKKGLDPDRPRNLVKFVTTEIAP